MRVRSVTTRLCSRDPKRVQDPRRAAGRAILIALALSGASCRSPGGEAPSGDPQVDLRSPSSRARADGAFAAGIEGRRDLLPSLVDALADPEAAVRAWAARSLFLLTGERLDYHPYLPPEERVAAIARWREWLIRKADEDKAPSDSARLPPGPPEGPRGGDGLLAPLPRDPAR